MWICSQGQYSWAGLRKSKGSANDIHERLAAKKEIPVPVSYAANY